jgi:transposase
MGGKRSKLDIHTDWLLNLIVDQPDLTLEEVRGRLRTRGIAVSASSVWRFFARHNITFKKKPTRRRTGPRGRAGRTRKVETQAAAA